MRKLWARTLYAVGVIGKGELKARIRILDDKKVRPSSLMERYQKSFSAKFNLNLFPGPWPFDVDRVDVGDGVYGPLNVLMHNKGAERLRIGNFCSIANNVTFVLASEHPYRGISTYPFKVKLGMQELEAVSKGDITVGDDVWIGLNAIISSGVKIGQGAIVAAGSVVTKDVAPYSIVGGNPAKFIKWRFEDEALRNRLDKLDWSKFDKSKVDENNIEVLYHAVSLSTVDDIERRFFKS